MEYLQCCVSIIWDLQGLPLPLFPLFFSTLYQMSSQKQTLSEQLAHSQREMEVQADSLFSALQEKEKMAKEKAQLAVELTALERHRKLLTEEADTLRYSSSPRKKALGIKLVLCTFYCELIFKFVFIINLHKREHHLRVCQQYMNGIDIK